MGVPLCAISFATPCIYGEYPVLSKDYISLARIVHAHYGIIDRGDFDHMVRLIEAFIRNFDQEALENLAE